MLTKEMLLQEYTQLKEQTKSLESQVKELRLRLSEIIQEFMATDVLDAAQKNAISKEISQLRKSLFDLHKKRASINVVSIAYYGIDLREQIQNNT
jgi:uncharacterized coiled-coil DUF342 family protein